MLIGLMIIASSAVTRASLHILIEGVRRAFGWPMWRNNERRAGCDRRARPARVEHLLGPQRSVRTSIAIRAWFRPKT
jgi:hypothetical protein